MLSRSEALGLIGLEGTHDASAVEAAFMARVTALEGRRSSAPTPALRDKYARQIEELGAARLVLLGPGAMDAAEAADLPVARPGEGGAPAGSGPGFGPRAGQVLGGRFELIELARAQASTPLYRARDRERGRGCALTAAPGPVLPGAEDRRLFLEGARRGLGLDHPNLVEDLDAGSDGPLCYVASAEAGLGETLRARLERLEALRGRLSAAEGERLAREAAAGLGAIHGRGLAHGKISPETIVFAPDGRARLAGLAVGLGLTAAGALGRAADPAGSVYLSAERIKGVAPDASSDLFALGATLYHALTGAAPVGRAAALEEVRSDLPRALARAIDALMAPDSAARSRAFTELTGEPAAPEREAVSRRAGATRKPSGAPAIGRTPMILAVIAAVIVAAIAIPMVLAANRGAASEREAIAEAQIDSARLQAEVKTLLDGMRERKRTLQTADDNARRAVDQIQNQIRSARSDADKAELRARLVTAQEQARLVDAEREAFNYAYDDPTLGYATLAGRLAAIEAALRTPTADPRIALLQLDDMKASFLKVDESVDGVTNSIRDEIAFKTLAGNFRLESDSCTDAFNFEVDLRQLIVKRPQFRSEYKLIERKDNWFMTDSDDDKFSFQRNGAQLLFRSGDADPVTLVRC